MKKYFILHPAVFKLDGGAMFGIIPKPLWSKFIPADELNRIELSLRVMLIQTPNKKILIDTGIGDYHGEKFDDRFGVKGMKDPLIESLQNNFGIKPSDITDLVVTHLHFDHVGGLGHEREVHTSIFPNATLHIHRRHYAYALKPTLRDSGSFHVQYFRPLIEDAESRGKINWLDAEEGLLLQDGKDCLYYKCSHGHTPFLLHPYDEQFIYMADLVPTSTHVPLPWVMGYDISPGVTTIDKKRFYDFILEKDLTLIFEHDMTAWGGKIRRKNESDYEIAERLLVNDLDPRKPEITFD